MRSCANHYNFQRTLLERTTKNDQEATFVFEKRKKAFLLLSRKASSLVFAAISISPLLQTARAKRNKKLQKETPPLNKCEMCGDQTPFSGFFLSLRHSLGIGAKADWKVLSGPSPHIYRDSHFESARFLFSPPFSPSPLSFSSALSFSKQVPRSLFPLKSECAAVISRRRE